MIDIHWRAKSGMPREKLVLECAKEYGCDPDTHLFDRLLADRLTLFQHHKAELCRIAEEEHRLAREKSKIMGG